VIHSVVLSTPQKQYGEVYRRFQEAKAAAISKALFIANAFK